MLTLVSWRGLVTVGDHAERNPEADGCDGGCACSEGGQADGRYALLCCGKGYFGTCVFFGGSPIYLLIYCDRRVIRSCSCGWIPMPN